MLLLNSTSDVLRLTADTDPPTIEVHASFVDLSAGTVAPGRTNTLIATMATTTIVGSPATSTSRNIKALYITNTGTACSVLVEHFDGTTAAELAKVDLLNGERLIFQEDGSWAHLDHRGAEYPPAGLGNYGGKSIPFMKSATTADVAGCWYCTSKDAGYPGAWSPGSPGVNGRSTDGTSSADYGCIPIQNSETGANYISSLELAASANHTNDFFDVLWVNSGLSVTTTTEQAIASTLLPARDANGWTDGEGCSIAMLATTPLTNSAANASITVRYTNSKGVSDRVATLSAIAGSQLPATAGIGTIIWFNLAAGDTGVQSIQGVTLGTSLATGAISLMICRRICTIGTTVTNVSASKAIGSPGILIYNNTCLLHCILASTAVATFFAGSLTVMEK